MYFSRKFDKAKNDCVLSKKWGPYSTVELHFFHKFLSGCLSNFLSLPRTLVIDIQNLFSEFELFA